MKPQYSFGASFYEMYRDIVDEQYPTFGSCPPPWDMLPDESRRALNRIGAIIVDRSASLRETLAKRHRAGGLRLDLLDRYVQADIDSLKGDL